MSLVGVKCMPEVAAKLNYREAEEADSGLSIEGNLCECVRVCVMDLGPTLKGSSK